MSKETTPMTTHPDPEPSEGTRQAILAELNRTDSKAAMLIAFVGAVMAGVIALILSGRLTQEAMVSAHGAIIMLAVTAAIMLWTVMPQLPRQAGGWVALARGRGDVVDGDVDVDVARLSRIAYRKYRLLQVGMYILLASLVLVVATVLSTAEAFTAGVRAGGDSPRPISFHFIAAMK
jgi:hypothetical protein